MNICFSFVVMSEVQRCSAVQTPALCRVHANTDQVSMWYTASLPCLLLAFQVNLERLQHCFQDDSIVHTSTCSKFWCSHIHFNLDFVDFFLAHWLHVQADVVRIPAVITQYMCAPLVFCTFERCVGTGQMCGCSAHQSPSLYEKLFFGPIKLSSICQSPFDGFWSGCNCNSGCQPCLEDLQILTVSFFPNTYDNFLQA